MRPTIYSLCMILALAGRAQELPGRDYLLRYSCVFNEQFDRERQDRYFNAELRLNDESSYFFITPDDGKPLPERDPNAVYFNYDTLLRVAKWRGSGQLVFGDPTFKGREEFFRDSLFPMKWELKDEYREIDSLQCAKAVTLFKGREYVCWYCPEIPVPEGPWKLGGLPGLIIEAYDTGDNLHFKLRSMSPSPPSVLPVHILASKAGDLPDYEAYRASWKGIARKMEASMGIAESAGCVSCQTRSKIKFYLWEKVLD
jgi:GLPGLI family protein